MRLRKRVWMAGTAVCLTAAVTVSALAATEHWNDNSAKTAISAEWSNWKTEWESVKTDYEKVSMAPGADETQMNYAWYSKVADSAKVRISTNADMSETVESNGTNTYKEKVTEFTGTCEEYKTIDDVLYYANKVTVTGLKENTTYYYQVCVDAKWSDTESFTTGDSSNFTFMYVGDPQIGASKGQTPEGEDEAQTAELAARNDSFSWNKTLTTAMNSHPEIDFILSAGDQINNTNDDNGQELEYAGFLNPQVLANVPIATTIGNHDSKYANYQNHFNVPNAYTEEDGATAAGNDYYYSYGNALFIVLNTNNYNCASHEKLIQKAVASDPDAKWKIVMFHQDIYGSGADHSDSDGIILRTQLTTILDKYDIDVVLQGHDHTYSRSYMLTSDGETHTSYDKSVDLKDETVNAEFQKQNLCYKIVDTTQGTINNPEGVLYMEANSSTGSKYYNLISTQQDYIAARSQSWTPTYSVVNMTDTSFSIDTYDVNTGAQIDDTFTITKTSDSKTDDNNTANTDNTDIDSSDDSNTSTVAVKKITVNKKKVTLKKGKTFQLKVTVSPKKATQKVTYKSSNKKVAAVTKSGIIKAKKKGTAVITIKAGTKKVTCKVKVK